ncbi:MAG: hypothetical protein FWH53_02085 [Leptospirales bacterium]|nr:hypothetical protein [Leptospirales bacterium]
MVDGEIKIGDNDKRDFAPPAETSKLTVTIAEELTNGKIMASPMSGSEGDEIYVYVIPDQGYKLKSLKYNGTAITNEINPQLFTFTLGKVSVTISGEFEKLATNVYTVTIGKVSNGAIIAEPTFGQAGESIVLTVTPDNGYILKEGSLTYTPAGGTAQKVTELGGTYTFDMPTQNVTVTCVFDEIQGATWQELLNAGIVALRAKNLDTAANAFEAAYRLNKTDKNVIVYSTLARLALIAKDQKVRTLIKDKLGVKNYPGTLSALITPNWLVEYTDEELVEWYWDNGTQLQWIGPDPADLYGNHFNNRWAYNYYGLSEAGYYKYGTLSTPVVHPGEKVKRIGDLNQIQINVGGNNYYASWYDPSIDTWFFSSYGFSQAGYYYQYYDPITYSYTYAQYSTTREQGELNYYIDATGRYYQWYDIGTYSYSGGVYSYEVTEAGYYDAQTSGYIFVHNTPKYEYDTFRLPGLDVPSWLGNTDFYNNSFTTTKVQSGLTFVLLMFSNLIDRNTNGLNDLLDGLLSSLFSDDYFKAAYDRVKTLKDSTLNDSSNNSVEIDKQALEALGISKIFEGEKIYIGKAELMSLVAGMRSVKAGLEWVTAYDWDTDLNFLTNGALYDDYLNSSLYKPVNLPLRNNFLKDRNNGMMTKSKASFITAIDDAIAAYNLFLTDNKLPSAYHHLIDEYKWVKDGFSQLKTAINNGGNFYVKKHDIGTSTYVNTQPGAVFGVNMGKFFTPGWFSLEKLVETENVSVKGLAPKFYGFKYDYRGDIISSIPLTNKTDFVNYDKIGFATKPMTDVIIYVMDSDNSNIDTNKKFLFDAFNPDFAQVLWDLYH